VSKQGHTVNTTCSVGADQRIEKEDINSYIAKKREMFLVQYSLGVKRDEISKLEEIAKVISIVGTSN